jgi:putative transposase
MRRFDIILLCKIAKVSRSGYYKFLSGEEARQKQEEKDRENAEIIRVFLGKYLGIYGYRRTVMHLAGNGIIMNHKKASRIMGKFNLHAKIRRKNPYRKIFKKTEEHRTFENLLGRNFRQIAPEKAGGTDITYIPFMGRFIYFSGVKDYCDGEILAWSASLHIDMPLVMETLDVLERRMGKEKLSGFLMHSDQGGHYTSPQYYSRIAGYGIIQSMSRKGNCIDNASIESFFGHMKDEIDISRCKTFEDAKSELADYVEHYNNGRRQWEKKKMTPVQYRNHLFSLAPAPK